MIWIDGGAIVGYCSIGIERIDKRAGEHDQDRDDDREDRPVDEELGHARLLAYFALRGQRALRGGCGASPRRRRDRRGRRCRGDRRLRLDRLHDRSRLHLLHAGDDDAIAVVQAAFDDPLVAAACR